MACRCIPLGHAIGVLAGELLGKNSRKLYGFYAFVRSAKTSSRQPTDFIKTKVMAVRTLLLAVYWFVLFRTRSQPSTCTYIQEGDQATSGKIEQAMRLLNSI